MYVLLPKSQNSHTILVTVLHRALSLLCDSPSNSVFLTDVFRVHLVDRAITRYNVSPLGLPLIGLGFDRVTIDIHVLALIPGVRVRNSMHSYRYMYRYIVPYKTSESGARFVSLCCRGVDSYSVLVGLACHG